MNFTPDEMTDFFEYLDVLRESGVTNMYGAGPYLNKEFNMNRADTREVILAWMSTFSHDEEPSERAAKALAPKP